MFNRLVLATAVVFGGGVLSEAPVQAASAGARKAAIGKAAPNFELPDCYGKKFKLSEFKGKVVVLEWLNRNCPVSRRKHTNHVMQKTLKKFADQGVVWLGIDSGWTLDTEKNRAYAAKQGLAYPILNDPTGRVGHLYGAKTTPHMFVIDKKGKLVYRGAIDGERIGKKDKNFVADAITAVLNGSTVAPAKTESYGCGIKYKR